MSESSNEIPGKPVFGLIVGDIPDTKHACLPVGRDTSHVIF